MRDGSADTLAWVWEGKPVAVGYDARGGGRSGRETVVLLPAFSTVSTREEMRALAERLAPDFRTITPDWPGFGPAGAPRGASYLTLSASELLCGGPLGDWPLLYATCL